MKLTLSHVVSIVLAAVMLAGVVYVTLEKRKYDNQIVALNNAIAEKDKTLEVTKGLYEKATLATRNLQDLLTGKEAQIVALKEELKKKDQEVVTATQLSLKWKKDYEALVKATQTTVPGETPTDPTREKVEFEKDFGPILVKGFTLTKPPEAHILLHQQKPLQVTVAISQDKNGMWHTYSTTNDENWQTDITLSAVNPYIAEKHWYERLSVGATVAGGPSGVLFGVGLGVDISRFTVSLMVYDHTANITSPLYGLGFQWRPFMK